MPPRNCCSSPRPCCFLQHSPAAASKPYPRRCALGSATWTSNGKSASQLWHWRTRGVALADGRIFDADLYAAIRDEELARLGGAGEGRLSEAAGLLDRLVLDDEFAEFLTQRAYSLLE